MCASVCLHACVHVACAHGCSHVCVETRLAQSGASSLRAAGVAVHAPSSGVRERAAVVFHGPVPSGRPVPRPCPRVAPVPPWVAVCAADLRVRRLVAAPWPPRGSASREPPHTPASPGHRSRVHSPCWSTLQCAFPPPLSCCKSEFVRETQRAGSGRCAPQALSTPLMTRLPFRSSPSNQSSSSDPGPGGSGPWRPHVGHDGYARGPRWPGGGGLAR